jgi:hypothetical protein
VSENSQGLKMSGLDSKAQESCRRIFKAFLGRHSLTSWDVAIIAARIPDGAPYNVEPYYELKIRFGSVKHEVVSRVKSEADLKDTLEAKLDELLEANYAAHQLNCIQFF